VHSITSQSNPKTKEKQKIKGNPPLIPPLHKQESLSEKKRNFCSPKICKQSVSSPSHRVRSFDSPKPLFLGHVVRIHTHPHLL